MRNPYIVGRWVTGSNHYGRNRLIQFLLENENPAIWIVGTRRMGKTSLLRQLEFLTLKEDEELVPLFWDIQGCESAEDLSYELTFTLEGVAERFTPYGVDVRTLEDKSAPFILRTLTRALHRQNRRLLLLIDEAEVLLEIGRNNPALLARLRQAMQEPWQRTIMTSTKLLLRLNEGEYTANTSPFLFGFQMVNLWSLDTQAAQQLVLQGQQPEKAMEVSPALVDEILVQTNRHPYLIQHLCQRLFESDEMGQGRLRPIDSEDMDVDNLLSGFFDVDFQHLTTYERRILLAIAEDVVSSDSLLATKLPDLDPGRISNFLYGLNKLGYLRRIYGQWTVGNEFLRRWIQDNLGRLSTQIESDLSDISVESMLTIGRRSEIAYLRAESERLEAVLLDLQASAAAGTSIQPPAELAQQIEATRQQLVGITREMKEVVNTDLIGRLMGALAETP